MFLFLPFKATVHLRLLHKTNLHELLTIPIKIRNKLW